jgi:FG-GAP-like repeat/Bacterial Ig-like domain (group 3)
MTHSPIVALKRYMTSRQVFVGRLMPVLLGALALGSAAPAAWARATTTTLTVATNPTPPTSGQVVTLTANVTTNGSGSDPAGGTVTFTDKYLGVTEVLGTVQVQSTNGTRGRAILATEIGGIGNHSFIATFNGTTTPNRAASTSATQQLNFTGLYASATSLAVTGTTAPYTLTGTVSAFGPVIPTGSVTFTDTTTSATLGTATLTNTPASQFTPFQSYPLANLNDGNTGGTIGPAIGDFNGDGRPDYAVPANSGSVFILLGKGDGTFTNGTTITTTSPLEPTSVVVGDFDGDGNQDLAVLSANGIGSVNIYLGNGNGTFAAPKNYKVATTTSGSRLLAVGDFDEDGIQDLVATNTSLNNVAVLLGNGDGSFQTAVPYALNTSGSLGQAPWNVVVGDINQDGHLDLAVASDNAGSVSILQGRGDGTFRAVTYVATGAQQVGSVTLGDFDGDGYPDLATTSAPDNAVYVLINNGNGHNTIGFGAATKYTMNSAPYYLTIGDFNRDGSPDIISANNGGNNVGVLLNASNGNGTFGSATYYGVGAGSIFANAGDINGDDRVDLTAVTNNGLSVLLSGQAETATLSNVTVAGCSVQSLVATYGGDGTYATSTSPSVNVTNGTLATTLTLGVAPAGAASGQQISLIATLAPYSQGSTTSNGDLVSFYNGATFLGTAPLSSGVAVFNYVLTGAFSFQATFPGDCSFVKSNSNTVAGTALLASTINWPTPAPITVGTPLSNTQLNATDSVPGTFVYTPASGTVLPAGTQTLSVTFTPSLPGYGIETATVQIVVQQKTVITWPTPTPITYGTPLTGFQLDATASTGIISVPLSSYYNVTGIYSPGSTYAQAASFDNDGYSYSTSSLGSTVVWNGLTFAIGPNNAPDAVSNITIPLPAGKFTNLYMLGAMVNNIGASQTFIVTYTDNSTLTFTQNMSDWFNVKGWAGESVVSCSEDRNFDNGTTQPDSACLFGYQIPLDPTKTVASVQLPGTRNIVMLSMDLTTPQIPGTFTYTPPAGTIEPVGTDTLSVVFTPTDPTTYQSASASVQLLVYPPPTPIVTTTINWPTPAPITYGTPLSATQLDATAMGLARPTPVTPISQLSVISTSTDGTHYNQPGFDNGGLTYSYGLLNNGQVNYVGITFTLGQPNVPNAITNGAVYSLGAAQGSYSNVYLVGAAIAAQTNVPFVLTYSDASTTIVPVNMSAWTASAGNAGETVIATTAYANNQAGNKVNAGNYYLYGYQLPVDSSKTLVSVTLPNTRNVVIMALGFGTNNTVVVPGTYTYTPPAGTTTEPVGTDTLSVSFVPSNPAGYTSATGTTKLVVTKATPVITWPTPTPILVNQPLTSTQLDATAATPEGASLPGTFLYSPAAGTSFSAAGVYPLNVTFTPTDTTDYTTAPGTVNITVGNGVAAISGAQNYTDCCFFSQPNPYTITVSGNAFFLPPTGTVTVIYNGTTLATGTLNPVALATSTVTVLLPSIQFYPGANNVTLQYTGGGFFPYPNTSSAAVITLRNPAIPVTPAAVGQTVNTPIKYRFPQDGKINFTYSPTMTNPEFSEAAFVSGDCQSGVDYNKGDECNFNVAFKPFVPGIRKGAIEVDFTPRNGAQAEPVLYLFLSGLGNASQIMLGAASQTTVLNAGLLEPQGVTFNPTDRLNSTLYVANSFAAQIVTLSSSGGSTTPWNTANTGNFSYPIDIVFDAFGNLVVADFNAAKLFSFNHALAEKTIGTGTITVGAPGAIKVDLAGDIFVADDGNTPQVVMIPGETFDTVYKPSVLLSSPTVSYPQALAVDNTGANLYVGDGDLNQVLKVALNGTGTSQVAIAPCAATVTPCAFNAPTGFAFDPNGDMYVTDGTPRLLMVPANHSSGGQTILMPMTGLVNPTNISVDGSGNIYVTDFVGTLTKLSVNVGALKVTASTPATTTVTNTGNLGLTITALTFANGAGSAYTESDTCTGNTIAPGLSCSITVTSKAGGTATDTLNITSNAFSTTAPSIKIN